MKSTQVHWETVQSWPDAVTTQTTPKKRPATHSESATSTAQWPKGAPAQLTWRDRCAAALPESWQSSIVTMTPLRITLVATLIGLTAGGSWWYVHGTTVQPHVIPQREALPGNSSNAAPSSVAAARPAAQPGAAPQPTPAIAPTTAQKVTVYVTGAVKTPGIVQLVAGARWHEAVQLAGGATKKAQLSGVNLAAVAADGQHLHIPEPGESPRLSPAVRSGSPGNGATGGGGRATVSLNQASTAELESLPGIGPVLAERIVAYRDRKGSFNRLSELQNVPGIGAKNYTALRARLTL